MNAVAFKPVLDGVDAGRALDAARELGAVVRDAERTEDPSLATGESGHAVALAHLDAVLPGEGFAQAADAALRAAGRAIARGRSGPGLMTGFTGVAWATAHLARLESAAADGATEAIDAALIGLLERGGWRAGFDLVSGVCGIGVYALERLPSPTGARLLELTVAELERLAVPDGPGIAWRAEPEHLHPEARAQAPLGFLDAGLAHGVPACVGVLAGALQAGIEGAGPLLDGAVRWLESVALGEPSPSLLPFGVGRGIEPGPARLAWCYGDAGAAAALLLAARAGHEPARALAERALERIARRDDAAASVQGASLCHGTAGIAHLCGRLDSLAGSDALAPAARRWIAATHELRDPGKGPGGFLAIAAFDETRSPGEVQGTGLLGGLAGVALALAAAATGADPGWDRALLVSPAPEPGS